MKINLISFIILSYYMFYVLGRSNMPSKQSSTFIEKISNDFDNIQSYIKESSRKFTQKLFKSIKIKKSIDTSTDNEDERFFSLIDEQNNAALKLLNNLLDNSDSWSFVARSNNVTVERRFFNILGEFVSKEDQSKGRKHACIKSSAIINAKPDDVISLFLDTNRAKEYNEQIVTIEDVYHFPKKSMNNYSKISYCTGPRIGPFQARDFCSVVNFIRNNDGSCIFLNRPAYYSKTKATNKYVRATILLAANLIKPIPNQPDKTSLTLIAHVNPGGAADNPTMAFFINKLCAMGPPSFVRKIEKSANNNRT